MYTALLSYRHRLSHRTPVFTGRGVGARCAVCLFGGDPMISFMLDRLSPCELPGRPARTRRARRRRTD